MKNYEKYADEIRKYEGETFCSDFVQPYILKHSDCIGMDCGQCNMLQTIWLMEEYEEPGVDWSKVEVDTPILVRDFEGSDWFRRHFAKYENLVFREFQLFRIYHILLLSSLFLTLYA